MYPYYNSTNSNKSPQTIFAINVALESFAFSLETNKVKTIIV